MPTVQATDDFNHAIDAGYYTDGFFNTPTAVTSPLYQSQPKSLQIDASGTVEGVRENLAGTPTRGWQGFPFRTSALATATRVGDFWAAGFSERAEIWLGATGLYVVLGASTSPEIAISANTWYWVEAIYDVSSGTHSLTLKVGATTQQVTTSVASTTVESAQLVGEGDTRTFHYGLWKYGSAASTSDWLGEPGGAIRSQFLDFDYSR